MRLNLCVQNQELHLLCYIWSDFFEKNIHLEVFLLHHMFYFNLSRFVKKKKKHFLLHYIGKHSTCYFNAGVFNVII